MGTVWTSDWSDERVATLKKLWLDGRSASQIAKQLGGVTRNAVIGKVHRLGLTGQGEGARRSASPPRAVAPRPAKAPAPAKPSAPAAHVRREDPTPPPAPRLGIAGNGHVYTQAPSAPLPRLRVVESSGKPARIIDPGFGGCRWPINDPGAGRMDETLFCCGHRDEGQAYCAQHRALGVSKVNNPLGPKTDKANDLIRQLRRYA